MTPSDLILIEQYLREKYILVLRSPNLNASDEIDERTRQITEVVVQIAAQHFGIKAGIITSRRRGGNGSPYSTAHIRYMVFRAVREITKNWATQKSVGKYCGRLDHTSVIHGIAECQKVCDVDPYYAADYAKIKAAAVRELGK